MSTQIGINKNLIKYLENNGYRSNELINKLVAETLVLGGVAQMQIAPEQGQFLEIITNELASSVLMMINKISKDEALVKINKVLDNGKAAEKFEMMVNALGGSKSFLSTYEKELSHNMYAEDINLGKDGWVKEMKTRELGLLLIELGGGRKQVNDQINYHVGYENVLGVGSVIEASTPVIKVLANSKDDFDRVKELIKSCFIISDQEVKKSLNIYEVIK